MLVQYIVSYKQMIAITRNNPQQSQNVQGCQEYQK